MSMFFHFLRCLLQADVLFLFFILCKILHTSYNLFCVKMWPDLKNKKKETRGSTEVEAEIGWQSVRACGSGRNMRSRDWTVNPAHIGGVAIRATRNYSSDSFDSDGVFAFIWVWTGTVPIHFAWSCDCEAVVRPGAPNQTQICALWKGKMGRLCIKMAL